MSGKVNVRLDTDVHARLRKLSLEFSAERGRFISMSRTLNIVLDIVEEARKKDG